MRKGRESYEGLYEKAVLLAAEGRTVKEIAAALNVSYSACYHWIKGLRKPQKGNINSFVEEIKKNGPLPAAGVAKKFPKHNELFLTAARRGMKIKRYVLPKKIGDYATWYFVAGQEEKLKYEVVKLMDRYKELKKQLLDSFSVL